MTVSFVLNQGQECISTESRGGGLGVGKRGLRDFSFPLHHHRAGGFKRCLRFAFILSERVEDLRSKTGSQIAPKERAARSPDAAKQSAHTWTGITQRFAGTLRIGVADLDAVVGEQPVGRRSG